MPMRDHFRPANQLHSWEGLHGQWPAMLVLQLSKLLPSRYFAEPRVHLGSFFEIDIATFEESTESTWQSNDSESGGTAVATYSPPKPSVIFPAPTTLISNYEALIFDDERHRELVAAIEIVSPANKDRNRSPRLNISCAMGSVLL